MTTLIILSTIVIAILIIVLLMVHTIYIKMDYLNINDIDNDNDSQNLHDTPAFQAGLNHGFSLIQICLYKMWDEQDILDFDSINDNIKNNLLTITKTKENFQTWNNKYTAYLKNKESGENNDI